MELFNAIISQAEYFDDLAEGTIDTDTRVALRDAANLTTTLARLVNGNGFRAAFGAPGDWGYSTPIGKTLYQLYSGGISCGLLDIEKKISDTGTLHPMDTAPKNGTEILLKVKSRAGIPGKFLVGHYMPGGHCIEDHPPISAGWYFWNGCAFDYAAEPIGWAPLPKEV
jgi:hypothetical protein